MANQNESTTMMSKAEAHESGAMERTRDQLVFVPRTDIYERPDAIVVVADMPGADENSIDINVEKNVLTLKGRVDPPQQEGLELNYSEYRIGDFERTFTLSNEIDVTKIVASIKDGVLRITLPKSEKMLPRKIEVKAN